jgi:hypothetical protein
MSLNTENKSVLQEWTFGLSFMQQSVLLTAVRGPDGIPKYHSVKYLLRWYRRCILLSSFMGRVVPNPYDSDGGSFLGPSIDPPPSRDPENPPCHARSADDWCDRDGPGGFMGHTCWESPARYWTAGMDALVSQYLQAADELPHHWQMHFMHAVEIVGYKHPELLIRQWWRVVYDRLVHDMHLFVETEEQMDRRLGDKRETWLERCDDALVK